ncbi:integral membrane protein [sediment metagenome]|uniref:Integral membrane protein n=1 Tax=sediment metagenome TaxID=749907 RepID=D9PGL8_9ZZZZ
MPSSLDLLCVWGEGPAYRATGLALPIVSRRGWILFASLGLIWGLPYLLIKVGVESLSVSMVIFSRMALGALILLPIAIATGQLKHLRGHWRWVIVFALVELTFTLLALTWAEQRISSSLAGLFVAAVPITTALIAWRLGLDDRLTGTRLVGMGVGIVGVGALVGFDVSSDSILAVLALVVTVVGYSLGPIIIDRRLQGVPGVPVMAIAIGLNAVIYAPFAWLTRPTEPVPSSAWVAIALLGVLCTAIAFVIFFALVREVGPSRTTLITYVNPAVAVVLGIVILDEPFTLGIAIGFPLVLLGSWLATRRSPAIESEPHA